jgi:hypothetical protein
MKATFLAMRLSISQKSFIFLITRFRQAMKTMFRLFFLGVVVIFPFAAEAQLLSVSGYVKNYISGQPIENVTIYETNSGIGTITNSDGFYRLLLQSGEQQLKISSAGFEDFKTTFKVVADTVVSVNVVPQNFTEKNFVAGKLDKDSANGNGQRSSVRKRK